MKALRERKAAAQAAKSDKSGVPGSNVGGSKNNGYLYRPYKCGLCDSAEETVADIRDHCKSVHENDKQVRSLTRFLSVSFFVKDHWFARRANLMTPCRTFFFFLFISATPSSLSRTLEGL